MINTSNTDQLSALFDRIINLGLTGAQLELLKTIKAEKANKISNINDCPKAID